MLPYTVSCHPVGWQIGWQAAEGAGAGKGSGSGVDQVFRDLGLAVDGHPLAGERAEVDAVALAGEAQLDAVVHQADPMHPLADLGRIEQVDRALLEHARADLPLDVCPAAAFQDDRVDALKMQELGEQQARGSRAHDANLRAHVRSVLVVLARASPLLFLANLTAG
jgi:hypothetical protein